MFKLRALAIAAAVASLFTAAEQASAQRISFALNWVPGGDHAPYYYALRLDMDFEPGRGSAGSAQRVGAGAAPLGLSDMAVVLNARGRGAELVAVMNIYANSPQGMYWLRSSGIRSIRDLAGRRIGNPPGDAARVMWPALARANGIDPNSVTWVNIDANAKLAALRAGSIDATTSFFNLHHVFSRELGDNMGFLPWREAGLNPYGNSIIVNGAWLRTNREKVAAFVRVTQRAFAECVRNAAPCVQALVDANGGLRVDNETVNWQLVTVLMSDEVSRTRALGWHDDARMENDYRLVQEFVGMERAYSVRDAYTNEFLDTNTRMVAVDMPRF
jgi:NitT/TauT family transport system substrate-binding protein